MPMNATSYGELTTYPNKVYFQCDEGFVLKGSSVRVCLANGSWSGNDTACEGVSSPVLAFSLCLSLLQILRIPAVFSFAVLCIIVFKLSSIFWGGMSFQIRYAAHF